MILRLHSNTPEMQD